MAGAVLADSYWGRYNTIIVALVIATVGHILLIVCSVPQVMDNIQGSYACLIIAIIVMGIGTGFFKSNIGPLICEQVPTDHMFVSRDKKGQGVLVDPGLTISNIFMLFYWMINIGAIAGQVGMSFAESEYDIFYTNARTKHNLMDRTVLILTIPFLPFFPRFVTSSLFLRLPFNLLHWLLAALVEYVGFVSIFFTYCCMHHASNALFNVHAVYTDLLFLRFWSFHFLPSSSWSAFLFCSGSRNTTFATLHLAR